MLSRVKELHYEYCAVKPKPVFKLWDSAKETYPETDEAETNSINIYVNLVV